MYNIIPLILILISLSVIIVIMVRRFSALASLDVDNIPAEKEAKFKERIIIDRLKRIFLKWSSRFSRLFRPVENLFGDFFNWLSLKFNNLKDSYKAAPVVPTADTEKRVEQLFNEEEELRRKNDLTAAEKKLIEIISLDSKNIRAFKALAHLYFERKDFEEAKQTFEHILKLKEDDEESYEGLAQIAKERGNLDLARDEYLKSLNFNSERGQTYFDLALVYEAMENYNEALDNLKKALKIEPKNPRYLDTMLRISIIIKDKALAADVFEQLKKVNPDNQKLAEFKAEMDKI